MNLADDRYDPAKGDIFARDGNAIHRLALRIPDGNGKPILVDAAGAVFNPWEVELLRWPSKAETELRRGGYLPDRPVDLELWCNCAD
jgi:hypothetical protein